MPCENNLMYFRSTPALQNQFRYWGPSPMTEELKERLEEMANLQGSIVSFGDRNIIFSHAVAHSTVKTLETFLVWGKQRQCTLAAMNC